MKISVVIPVFNEEEYIENCLISLKKQLVLPDEIVVVNNNCTDRTILLAKKHAAIIAKEDRQGLIFARNRGFDTARYEIIARTDADTVLPFNWIKKIKENFTKEGVDALTGPIVFSDFPIKLAWGAIFYMRLMKIIQKGEILLGPNMALTKKMWQKVRNKVCLDERKVHEDIDLSWHILEAGGQIIYDWSLIVPASSRRIKKNPLSFFGEYPLRAIKTLKIHHYSGD